MDILKGFYVTLAFILEIAMVWSIGFWGFQTSEVYTKFLFGLGLPVLVAIFWGMLMAPKAQRRVRQPWRLIIGSILFSLGACALYAANQPAWGYAYAVAIVVYIGLSIATYKIYD